MAKGLARIRTQNNSYVLVNPDEVSYVSIDDTYRPNGFCTIHLKDGTMVKSGESMDDTEIRLAGAR